MSIISKYLAFKNKYNLKVNSFNDRVVLQNYIRDHLDEIWEEKPNFANGGLLNNYMTKYAIGFAYYDCRSTPFCRERCYGLPIAGPYDYYMLRLGVITSESFKTGDMYFINEVKHTIQSLDLECLKIGHWGDAVIEQVPHMVNMIKEIPNTFFWWYTRKQEIAFTANNYGLNNLRVYLSLDPNTEYPSHEQYPFGITYFLGDGLENKKHEDILKDDRLVAIFPKKHGSKIEDIDYYGIREHPKLCIEKKHREETGKKEKEICLKCIGRCNYSN